MDLVMPVLDGIAAIRAIRNELPEIEVLVLASVLEKPQCRGDSGGAISYLLKDTQAAELRTAIKVAAAGQVQLFPRLLHISWVPSACQSTSNP